MIGYAAQLSGALRQRLIPMIAGVLLLTFAVAPSVANANHYINADCDEGQGVSVHFVQGTGSMSFRWDHSSVGPRWTGGACNGPVCDTWAYSGTPGAGQWWWGAQVYSDTWHTIYWQNCYTPGGDGPA